MPSSGTGVLQIGNYGTFNGGIYSFSGILDEIRISSTVRSADWVATEYNNQSAPSTFYSIGTSTISSQAPAIVSANNVTFVIGSAGLFTVSATGYPLPTLSESGATLPSGVTFNATTGVLSGTPASGTNGTYSITFTASNGVGSNATQSFTLTVATTGASVYYYLGDALGSSRVITDSNGTVCYDSDFYPYGGERSYTSTCPQSYKFTGKEHDTESWLDDFGARYYSSEYGRWMSADWSAIPAPVPYANLSNPQTLNLYAMVSDNPETFADLDGHHWWNKLWNLVVSDAECWCEGAVANQRRADFMKRHPDRMSPEERKKLQAFVTTIIVYNMVTSGAQDEEETGAGDQQAGAAADEAGSTAGEAIAAPESVDIVTQDGTKVTGFTEHGVNRAVGDTGERAGTKPGAILDALKNPIKITSGIDQLGRPFKVYTGENARVVLNPDTGKIVSVNPMSREGAH